MNFALFILLNAILLIRPEELLPDIAGMRLYLIVIVLCTLTTVPGVMAQLSSARLRELPITVCALGLLVAMALSQILRGQLGLALNEVSEFAKVILYFLLLMAIVNTPERLKAFVGWIVLFVIVLATMGLLQYHNVVDIEALRPIEQKEVDPETGEITSFPRLCASGIYHDPNDLCLILATGSLACLCRAFLTSSLILRVLWLCPIGLFAYTMMLTQSRGGLLGFMAGGVALVYGRFGGKRSLLLAIAVVAISLALFAGRQTDFNTGGEDTAQARMQLWAEGLSLMLSNPLTWGTGIGVGEYGEQMGQVAHNSFVHAYVETGLVGGTLFLGAFVLAATGLNRTRKDEILDEEPILRRMQPFIFAMVIAYAAGMYSLSRNFVVPTYLILGLAASFIAIAYYDETPSWWRFDGRMLVRLAMIGVLGLVFLKLFTQSLVQWSGG
jgi:hypothetical protein